MTLAQLRNWSVYILLGLLLVIAKWSAGAITSGEVDWFASAPVAQYKGLALAILDYLVPILLLAVAAYRTRVGSEGVATQVNDLRADGVSRSQMVVLSEDDAAAALSGEINGLTPTGKRKLLGRLEASLSKE